MGESWWPTPDGGLEYYQHMDEWAGVRWSPFRCNEVMRNRPWTLVENFYDKVAAGEASRDDLKPLSITSATLTDNPGLAPGVSSEGSESSRLAFRECSKFRKSSGVVEPDGAAIRGRPSFWDDRFDMDGKCKPGDLSVKQCECPKDKCSEGERLEAGGFDQNGESDDPGASVERETAGESQLVASDGQCGKSDGPRASAEKERVGDFPSDGWETAEDREATVGYGRGSEDPPEVESDGGERADGRESTVGCAGGSEKQLERQNSERREDLRKLESDSSEAAETSGSTVGCSNGSDSQLERRKSETEVRDFRSSDVEGRPEISEASEPCAGVSDRQLERRNFKVVLAYSGRHFWGWQKQTGQETVQDALERALRSVLDKRETRPKPAPGCYLSGPLAVEAIQAEVAQNGRKPTKEKTSVNVDQESMHGAAEERSTEGELSLDTWQDGEGPAVCGLYGAEQTGTELHGTERDGKEQSGSEPNGTEQNGSGRNGTARELRGWDSSNRTERSGNAEATGTERNGTVEADGTEENGTERSGTFDASGTERKETPESSGTGPSGMFEATGTARNGVADANATERNEPAEKGGTIESLRKQGNAARVGGHFHKTDEDWVLLDSGSEPNPILETDGMDCLTVSSVSGRQAAGSLPKRSSKKAAKRDRDARRKAPVETTNASVAGRTDRGVSAAGQVVSWYTRYMDVDCDDIADAINREAPGKLRAVRVSLVSRSFHAQFSAQWRSYVYLFPLKGGELLPDGSLRLHPPGSAAPHQPRGTINVIPPSIFRVTSLDEMLRQLEGRSISYGSYARDTRPDRSSGQPVMCHLFKARADVVTLTSLEGDPSERHDALRFSLVGNRFLHRMVRVIVATTIREAAAGSPPDALLRLASLECRRATAPPAPPQGLTLLEVGYEEFSSDPR